MLFGWVCEHHSMNCLSTRNNGNNFQCCFPHFVELSLTAQRVWWERSAWYTKFHINVQGRLSVGSSKLRKPWAFCYGPRRNSSRHKFYWPILHLPKIEQLRYLRLLFWFRVRSESHMHTFFTIDLFTSSCYPLYLSKLAMWYLTEHNNYELPKTSCSATWCHSQTKRTLNLDCQQTPEVFIHSFIHT